MSKLAFALVLLAVAGVSSLQVPNNNGAEAAPEPYAYSYETDTHAASEQRDQAGNVVGYYTLAGPDGRARRVEYTADANGFRARVMTNEIGTRTSNPANVEVIADQPTAEQIRQATVVGVAQPQAAVVATRAPVVQQPVVQVQRTAQQVAYPGYATTGYQYVPAGYNYGTGYRGYGVTGYGNAGYVNPGYGLGGYNNVAYNTAYNTGYQYPGYYRSYTTGTVAPQAVGYTVGRSAGVNAARVGYQTVPAAVSYQTVAPARAANNLAGSSNYIVLKA